MWKSEYQERNVNPTDVLEAEAMLDEVYHYLRKARRGLRSLRRTYRTGSAGLLPAARAASLAARLTEEFSALLSYMEETNGDATQETETTHCDACETSPQTSASNADNDGFTHRLDRSLARLGRSDQGLSDPEVAPDKD